ncbi:OmpA family protein [Brevundimonas sp.]|jgi:peptidoglycan-associated lipoprotein|uniref:OmpA family protein n=1 Tax=Brevundimonas sp. TaxID=1871086 RepID=UPI0037C00EAA
MKHIAVLAMTGGMLALGACAMPMKREAIVAGESMCSPARFDIYFQENDAGLTEAADQAIMAAAGVLRACDVRRVQVLGLADATGASEANLTLSQRRARTVAQALNGAGLPAPVFDVAAAGDAEATTATGAAEPLRRRTVVVVDAHPRR